MLKSIYFLLIFVPNLVISPLNRHFSPLNVKIHKKTEPTTKADSNFQKYSGMFPIKCILIRRVLGVSSPSNRSVQIVLEDYEDKHNDEIFN